MSNAWNLLAQESEAPELFTDLHEGSVVEGVLNLVSMRETRRVRTPWTGRAPPAH